MIIKTLRKIFNTMNYDLVNMDYLAHKDFQPLHNDIIKMVSNNTMTTKERLFGLIEATKYISKNKIEGDIVECGVWRGGSMMAAALTLLKHNDQHRQLYLYDTYEGMSEPTKEDINSSNEHADHLLTKNKKSENNILWAYSTLETVQAGMNKVGYPKSNIHYIKGKVEDTIPQTIPEKIALLRLDTDWYESTKHELIHLFPRLVKGGVLIIDDYGDWQGAKKAVDEYFEGNNIQILLTRMDSTGRMAVKL